MSGRKKLIVSVMLAAILVTGLGISRWAHRGDLSNRGRRIGRLPGAVNYLQPISPEWISDHEAIYMSYRQDGDQFELTKVNTDTGSSSAMAELNAKYAYELRSITVPRTRPPWHVAPDMVVSPSGTKIVLVRDDRYRVPPATTPVVYHVIYLATGTDVAFPVTQSLSNPFSPIWFPDSKQWVLPFYPGVPGATMNALIYDTDHPSSVRKTGLSAGPAFGWMPVGVTAAGKCWGIATTQPGTSIVEWDVTGNTVANQTTVALAVTGYVSGAALSPDRDRVAWLIRYHVETPVSAIMRRIHRGAKQNPLENPKEHIGIWVSKLDGAEMKQVGTEDVSNAWYSDGYIRWLPGGKKLAFHLGMDLYTISVDRWAKRRRVSIHGLLNTRANTSPRPAANTHPSHPSNPSQVTWAYAADSFTVFAMSNTPIIRIAVVSDILALSELAILTYKAAFGHTFTDADLAAHLNKHLSHDCFSQILQEDTVLVAELDDRLIGYLQFGGAKSVSASEDDFELRRLYVHPEFQNMGYGSALMEAALCHWDMMAATNIYLDVWEHNIDARRFYKRYGFEVVGTRAFELESRAETSLDLVMVRRNASKYNR